MADIEEKENHDIEAVNSMSQNGSSGPSPSKDTRPEGAAQPEKKKLPPKGFSVISIIFWVLIALICIVAALYLILVWVSYLIFGIDLTKYVNINKLGANLITKYEANQGKSKNVFERVQDYQDATVSTAKTVAAIRNRIAVTSLVWLVINLSVPGLRRKTVLGSPLWLYSVLVVIIACGYIAVSKVTGFIVDNLTRMKEGTEHGGYFMNETRRSFNLIIFSAFVFITWHFYFLSKRGLKQTSDTDDFFDYMTWTLVAFIIFSVLWLVKAIQLSRWEAEAVYHRFRARILTAGSRYFFLQTISGTSWDRNGEEEEVDIKDTEAKLNVPVPSSKEDKKEKYREEKGKKEAKKILMLSKKDVTTRRIKWIANYLVSFSRESSRDDDDISPLQAKWREIKPIDREISVEDLSKFQVIKEKERGILYGELQGNNPAQKVTYAMFENWASEESSKGDDVISNLRAKCREIKDDLGYITVDDLSKFHLEQEESEQLFKELQESNQSEKVTYAMFEKWMVRAHKYCLALGYTLIDAKAVVDCLNQLMTGSVIVVVIIAWLQLTGIATTKVLITILSPLLAATFIFGDTCKTLFQGIIFAFVKHPFDVGDRCIIDGIELEVKRMNILTTIFLESSGGETSYPNSMLGAKPIVNLKGDPDPSDSLELNLHCTTKMRKINTLQNKILDYLECNDHKYEKRSQVFVKEIGSSIKMCVSFKHSMSILDVTYAQYSDKKKKQKSEFLQQVKQYLEELEIDIALG